MKFVPEMSGADISDNALSVIQYLETSEEEIDRLAARRCSTALVVAQKIHLPYGSASLDYLVDTRQNVIRSLTDQILHNAGFILLPVEQPNIWEHSRAGTIFISSFSKIGGAVLVEETKLDIQSGLPIEYEAQLVRRHMNFSPIFKSLSGELEVPVVALDSII